MGQKSTIVKISLLDAKTQTLEIQNRTPNSKKLLPEFDGSLEVEKKLSTPYEQEVKDNA